MFGVESSAVAADRIFDEFLSITLSLYRKLSKVPFRLVLFFMALSLFQIFMHFILTDLMEKFNSYIFYLAEIQFYILL